MSKFVKGQKRPKGAGRKQGTPNKTTKQGREAIAELIEGKIGRMDDWLEEIYETNGAEAAFKCVVSIMEYHVPKLNRGDLIAEKHEELFGFDF